MINLLEYYICVVLSENTKIIYNKNKFRKDLRKE
jgi:hypothetical protein